MTLRHRRTVNDKVKTTDSWNQKSFHEFARRGLRLSRSERVRRQGLEPRTRGLRACPSPVHLGSHATAAQLKAMTRTGMNAGAQG